MAFTNSILVRAGVVLVVLAAGGGKGLAKEERALIHKIPPLSAAGESVIVTLPPLRPALDFDEATPVGRKASTAPALEEAPLLRKTYDAPTLAEAPAPEPEPPAEKARSYAQWEAVAPSSPLLENVSREGDIGATAPDPCVAVLTTPAGEGVELARFLELAKRPVASSSGSDPLSPPPARMCGGDVSVRTVAAESPQAEAAGVGLMTIGLCLASILFLAGLLWRRRRARDDAQPVATGVMTRVRRLLESLPLPAGVLGGAEARGVDSPQASDASILSKVAVLMRGRREEEPPAAPVNLARIVRPARTSGSAAAILAEPVFEQFDAAIDAPRMRLGAAAVTVVEAPARPAPALRPADTGAEMETDDLDLVEPGDAVAASAAINAARTRLETQR